VRAILEHHAGVKGILFDQPQVVERALLPEGERFTRTGGDFFREVPPGADLYLIRGVLHDFGHQDALAILKNIRRAMSPRSRLLSVERRISPDNRPAPEKTIDVLMMALLGGTERSVSEWEGLLGAAGLALSAQHPTGSEFTIFECAPLEGAP
jgi:hypothetical protein